MTLQSVTVQLPTGLYNLLKRRAEQAHHSIEAEVLETVAATVPVEQDLSPDLLQAISQLANLNDDALWQAAKARFSKQKSAHLEALHLQRQNKGLSSTEAQHAAELADELEQFMFLRAQAISFLMQRGYNVSTLVTQ